MELTEKFVSDIAIVGGGCSGVLLAAHLRRNGFPGQIHIIEPRSRLGRGLAYSTTFPQHVLNVSAEKMSAFPDEPLHFLDWLRNRVPEIPDSGYFAPRMIYGEYLEDLLRNDVAGLAHVRAEVAAVERAPDGYTLKLSNGQPIRASKVVLALGNPLSSPFPVNVGADIADKWNATPWSNDALKVRLPGERILLIGTGLTAVDAALALRSQDIPCEIGMVSRRGILPCTHTQSCTSTSPPDFPSSSRVGPLLRLIRAQIESMREEGRCWRTVIDSLRSASNGIWNDLPLRERARFVRHLKPYWEPHRHRMAPQVRSRLDQLLREGSARIVAGRILKITKSGNSLECRIHLRNREEIRLSVDRIINCSGIQERYSGSPVRPFIKSLIKGGLAEPNDLGIGFRTSAEGALVTADEGTSPSLFTLGPTRRGELFETTAVPEIRVQAETLARLLVVRGRRCRLDGTGAIASLYPDLAYAAPSIGDAHQSRD